MSDPRPRLEVVGGGSGAAPPEPAREAVSQPPAKKRSRAVIVSWVLGCLLAIALVGGTYQGRRADLLSEQVVALESELAAAYGALRAHRSHLEAVRDSVADLQALVARGPAPVPAAPRAPEPPTR